jgi:hypothetical protein
MCVQRSNGEVVGVDFEHPALVEVIKEYGMPLAELIVEKKREIDRYCPSGYYPTPVNQAPHPPLPTLHASDHAPPDRRSWRHPARNPEVTSPRLTFLAGVCAQILYEGERELRLAEVCVRLVDALREARQQARAPSDRHTRRRAAQYPPTHGYATSALDRAASGSSSGNSGGSHPYRVLAGVVTRRQQPRSHSPSVEEVDDHDAPGPVSASAGRRARGEEPRADGADRADRADGAGGRPHQVLRDSLRDDLEQWLRGARRLGAETARARALAAETFLSKVLASKRQRRTAAGTPPKVSAVQSREELRGALLGHAGVGKAVAAAEHKAHFW